MCLRLIPFIALCIALVSCSTTEEEARSSSQIETKREVYVTVDFTEPYASDNNIYLIGAPLAFDIGVENNSQTPVEFHNFVVLYHKLAFFTPQQVHLIAPNGQDLLLPYKQNDSSSGETFRVEAQDSDGTILFADQFLRLREPGRYSFWVELEDETGESYRSNTLTFHLEDSEPSVPSNLIELRLNPLHDSYAMWEGVDIEVTFTNLTDNSLTFLKPQDGSTYGWINPIYNYSSLNEHGQRLPTAPGDQGLPPIYDETTMFTLEPEESFSFTNLVPGFNWMQKPGDYQVQLTYIVRANKLDWSVRDEPMNWDEDVFIGRLESNRIDITIR